jgi:TP53 regulating kinase-like protein
MVEKISEGAEADIYKTSIFGIGAIIKHRKAKAYREAKLDTSIRERRTKIEANILYSALNAGVNVPLVLFVGKYSIYEKFVNGLQLSLLLKEKKLTGQKLASCMTKVGKYLAILHSSNIVHGDFTPANIIVSKKNVYIIDFGFSEITSSKEDKALDLLLMKRSVSNEAFAYFKNSYIKNEKESKQILLRLAEIEKRGRHQTRTLQVKE